MKVVRSSQVHCATLNPIVSSGTSAVIARESFIGCDVGSHQDGATMYAKLAYCVGWEKEVNFHVVWTTQEHFSVPVLCAALWLCLGVGRSSFI